MSSEDREDSPSNVEDAFADFLRRRKQGEDLDFEAFCSEHPEIAESLRMRRMFHDTGSTSYCEQDQTVDVSPPSDQGIKLEVDQIGPYKILEKLGEGGMGIVYLAEQRHPIHRRVALKVIKLGMDTKEVVARFEVERQALAMMDHPNIARIYDAGATKDGRPYFAMQAVEGIPITDYCDRHKLSIAERLRLFLQVCQAIEHAHHRGIIHSPLSGAEG